MAGKISSDMRGKCQMFWTPSKRVPAILNLQNTWNSVRVLNYTNKPKLAQMHVVENLLQTSQNSCKMEIYFCFAISKITSTKFKVNLDHMVEF